MIYEGCVLYIVVKCYGLRKPSRQVVMDIDVCMFLKENIPDCFESQKVITILTGSYLKALIYIRYEPVEIETILCVHVYIIYMYV